jgi:hypothetical protein
MVDEVVDKISKKDVGQIFSFIDILKISSNVGEFRKWLKEYHKIEDDSQIFDGYKFFILDFSPLAHFSDFSEN